MHQVADAATELIRTHEPDRALRAWMDHLARFAMTKAGLADAIRQATSTPGSPEKPGHTPVTTAAELLLRTNEEAGTIRPGVTGDDFVLAISRPLATRPPRRLATPRHPPPGPRHGRPARGGPGRRGAGLGHVPTVPLPGGSEEGPAPEQIRAGPSMEPPVGFEPTTYALQVRCSGRTELRRHAREV